MLPENITAVVARNERWSGSAASEPHEAGWAREAVFFVRALAEPAGPQPMVRVEISPDGMHWVAEGTQAPMPTTRDGLAVPLGPTEFRLLRHFLEHPGRVFSREQLLDAVWGRDVYVEQRTVDVHIRRLRKAINGEGEGTAALPDVIRTVRSAGYALDREAH